MPAVDALVVRASGAAPGMGEMNALAPPHRVLEPLNDGGEYRALVAATDNPHSIVAEQAVLGALMLDFRRWRDVLDIGLVAADFFDDRHQIIFDSLAALAARGETSIDPMLVDEELRARAASEVCGGLKYLVGLSGGEVSGASAVPHAKLVREYSARRQLISMSSQIAVAARVGKSLEQVFTEVREILALAPRPNDQQPRPQLLDLRALRSSAAPARHWFLPQWLGPDPTLMASLGGVGKTMVMQTLGTCGALARSFITAIEQPFSSLLWACEDTAEELWRRQERISEHLGVDLDAPADRLHLESRRGVDSMLIVPLRGVMTRTPVYEQLRQQVNDLRIDVLQLDNVAHLFGGDENDRGHVTTFINSLAGLVTGRPFGIVLAAHVSRKDRSEFAGSAAWENAVRMRWFLGRKLPDDKATDDEDPGSDNVRYLAKRKSNYSARDYVRFTMRPDGTLEPDEATAGAVGGHVGRLVRQIDEGRAEAVCLAGFRKLKEMGIDPTDGKTSPNNLPLQLVEKGLAEGFQKHELRAAMNRLMTRGTFAHGAIGRYQGRAQRFGLILTTGESEA